MAKTKIAIFDLTGCEGCQGTKKIAKGAIFWLVYFERPLGRSPAL